MAEGPSLPPKTPAEPWVEVQTSRHFAGWLADHQVSLAFTTYQAGKLFLIGRTPEGRASVFERTFNRCMGLWGDAQTLWMTSLYQLWRFENALGPGETFDNGDRLFIPRVGYTTGELDAHDVAVESTGRVVFVNTLFNCLATLSVDRSFTPLWKPPFVSKLLAEDRCHLNGLALEDGRAAFVTATSTSDVTDGWRGRRHDGGVVVDVRRNEVVCTGLSMPHSPRMYRGKLYLHNSGAGYFGSADRAGGAFEPIAFCPGYLRGLAFVGDYAVVGLSKPRDKTFSGLALDAELTRHGAGEARCGLHVIDLRTGATPHWLQISGMVTELYDVVALPGAARPTALGFKTDQIQRTIAMGEPEAL